MSFFLAALGPVGVAREPPDPESGVAVAHVRSLGTATGLSVSALGLALRGVAVAVTRVR